MRRSPAHLMRVLENDRRGWEEEILLEILTIEKQEPIDSGCTSSKLNK
jgi:hypothetical protein